MTTTLRKSSRTIGDVKVLIHYRFTDGAVGVFAGKPSWYLSNSYQDAVSQIRERCRELGEEHNPDREFDFDRIYL